MDQDQIDSMVSALIGIEMQLTKLNETLDKIIDDKPVDYIKPGFRMPWERK